jgi:hypothetical protein
VATAEPSPGVIEATTTARAVVLNRNSKTPLFAKPLVVLPSYHPCMSPSSQDAELRSPSDRDSTAHAPHHGECAAVSDTSCQLEIDLLQDHCFFEDPKVVARFKLIL